jgi:hypothetical protein
MSIRDEPDPTDSSDEEEGPSPGLQAAYTKLKDNPWETLRRDVQELYDDMETQANWSDEMRTISLYCNEGELPENPSRTHLQRLRHNLNPERHERHKARFDAIIKESTRLRTVVRGMLKLMEQSEKAARKGTNTE